MEKSDESSLINFKSQEQSFPERFVDAVFHGHRGKAAGDIFATAYSDGGYMPTFIDAQHWAAEIMQQSKFEAPKKLVDLDLIGEIFFGYFVPYDTGEMSLEEAKSAAVKHAEEFFQGTVGQLMFGEGPTRPEWYASHIYRLGEELQQLVEDYVCERKEIDALAGDVDDYYVSAKEAERDQERKKTLLVAVDRGVKIGFLYRDAWWRFTHEQAAVKYYEQAEARKKGSPKGGDSTAKRYAALKRDCLGYFPQAYRENGTSFLGAPLSVVARSIREIALRDRPNDFVGPKGEPLSERWFEETLEYFQSGGEFGAAIEKALKKA